MSDGLSIEDKTIPLPLDMLLVKVIKNKETFIHLKLALERLDRYVAMSKLQNERIWEAERQGLETIDQACTSAEMEKGILWLESRSIEAHFYLICWDAVAKIIDTICQSGSGLKAPRSVWKRHRKTLESYQEVRDHLEHWTERLPWEKKKKDQWQRSSSQGSNKISGNMGYVLLKRTFTFRDEEGHDKEVDISPASAELLEHICKQLNEEMVDELHAIVERRRHGR